MTLILLGSSKQLRESLNAAEFGNLGSTVADLQSNPVETLQTILAEHCGYKWDGQGKLSDAILAEQLRRASVEKARAVIDEKLMALQVARLKLHYENISGPEIVAETVKQIGEES